MAKRPRNAARRRRQSGIALPVMLIMLTVMLISSIYLLRSTTSTTLTTANLAYNSSLSKAADLGIHTAYNWLSTVDHSTLINDIPASGYVSRLQNWDLLVTDSAFWTGSTTITDTAGNQIEYVIHRLCTLQGLNAGEGNQTCLQTSAKSNVSTPAPLGTSLSQDAPAYAASAELHYLITARIQGARGANVVNEATVMMGQ